MGRASGGRYTGGEFFLQYGQVPVASLGASALPFLRPLPASEAADAVVLRLTVTLQQLHRACAKENVRRAVSLAYRITDIGAPLDAALRGDDEWQ